MLCSELATMYIDEVKTDVIFFFIDRFLEEGQLLIDNKHVYTACTIANHSYCLHLMLGHLLLLLLLVEVLATVGRFAGLCLGGLGRHA